MDDLVGKYLTVRVKHCMKEQPLVLKGLVMKADAERLFMEGQDSYIPYAGFSQGILGIQDMEDFLLYSNEDAIMNSYQWKGVPEASQASLRQQGTHHAKIEKKGKETADEEYIVHALLNQHVVVREKLFRHDQLVMCDGLVERIDPLQSISLKCDARVTFGIPFLCEVSAIVRMYKDDAIIYENLDVLRKSTSDETMRSTGKFYL
ncbi:MAG: hypothetical protein V1725_05510 [archaeon]